MTTAVPLPLNWLPVTANVTVRCASNGRAVSMANVQRLRARRKKPIDDFIVIRICSVMGGFTGFGTVDAQQVINRCVEFAVTADGRDEFGQSVG